MRPLICSHDKTILRIVWCAACKTLFLTLKAMGYFKVFEIIDNQQMFEEFNYINYLFKPYMSYTRFKVKQLNCTDNLRQSKYFYSVRMKMDLSYIKIILHF